MLKHKKIIFGLMGGVVLSLVAWAGMFYWDSLRGIGPVFQDSDVDIVDELEKTPQPGQSVAPGHNNTQFPLTLQPGFSISLFAKNLPGARVIAFDHRGNMAVSQTKQGTVSYIIVENGAALEPAVLAGLSGLRNPHGLVFDPARRDELFVAEETRIIKRNILNSQEIPSVTIVALPEGGRHTTRTLGISPDKQLYVAIGSTCDVCHEKNPRIATVQTVDTERGILTEFAKGLRNTVFFAFHPTTGKMWGTEMGRDMLGDDLPPDEINIIEDDGNYGWPTCFGKNIHDTQFDKNTYIRNPCMEPMERASHIDLPAHSAPLGLAFIPPSSNWPREYHGDLLVAYHGSWNRSTPTGYKIVRMKLAADGSYESSEDFISGWLDRGASLGRPVDLKFGPDGNLYVSDDKAGVVYTVSYRP